MKLNIKKSIGRSIAFVMILYLIFSGNRGLWNLYQLEKEEGKLEGEIVLLESENEKVKKDMSNFGKNPEALEKIAREELNLIKPGELIYRFTAHPNQ